MNQELMVVFDAKVERFLEPFAAPSVAFALREFTRAANGEGQVALYPEDYTLFHVGTFNAESGEITAQSPRSIAVAITLVRSEPEGVLNVAS